MIECPLHGQQITLGPKALFHNETIHGPHFFLDKGHQICIVCAENYFGKDHMLEIMASVGPIDNDAIEILGGHRGGIYMLNYVGGPMDGQEVYSPRPYDAFQEHDKSIYRADEEGESCLEWVDDETRRITLYYQGKDATWPPPRPYQDYPRPGL